MRTKPGIPLLTGIVLLALSPLLAEAIIRRPLAAGIRSDDPTASEQRNRSAFAIILGNFRSDFSDLIFIKTERYLHSGVGFVPHLDTEAMSNTGEVKQKGAPGSQYEHDPATCTDPTHHHDKDGHDDHESTTSGKAGAAPSPSQVMEANLATPEMRETAELKPGEKRVEEEAEGVATIVPTRNKDFRGFVGDLERAVKPWHDPSTPHTHTAGTELLPWYRLATMSNPNNIRAYMIGAWWLKAMHKEKQREEAVKFLDEGIQNNPKAFQLHVMKGVILREQGKTTASLEAFLVAADLGLAQRPVNYEETTGTVASSQTWTHYMEDDLTAALNFSVLTVRNAEGLGPALRLAKQFQARRGDIPPLNALITRLQSGGGAAAALFLKP
ncbi:MAG: hypothetical protein K1X53_03490 [Candidatus Sumerlaeaceae bacterium]|nr:hypothetical protein [Candidatus Sumerlaeaceae bacterium]